MDEMAISTHLPVAEVESPGGMRPADHVIVLFGATGDLARRKLLPGFYRLHRAGLMPEDYRIIGTASADLSDEDFRDHAHAALEEFASRGIDEDTWSDFACRLAYVKRNGTSPLAGAVEAAEREVGGSPRRLYYLSLIHI